MAQACGRHGVSHRTAAAIAFAVLQNFDVICNVVLSKVIVVELILCHSIQVDKLVAVKCYVTKENSGRNNGQIRLLDVEFHKPLQWFVCQLHANELPLRQLTQLLEGATSGPRAFPEAISKELLTFIKKFKKHVNKLPVVCVDITESDFHLELRLH